ncbi:MAG: hypothetical protein COB69_06825 [Phycisphaera sp.]|nr:MAG: hypothetical protein COB69_06825 [Phycisphaera sp.]
MLQEPAATRYCIGRHYQLSGLQREECPECGLGFDAHDLRTTTSKQAGNIWRALATLGQLLTVGACFILAGILITSAIGVEPLFLWLAGIVAAPFILILVILTAIPAVNISTRTRVLALACVVVFVSVVLTGWPFRLTFMVHRPELERYVA